MASESSGYKITFVRNIARDGHTEYQAEVVDPNERTWTISKRYRELRELHDQMKLRFPNELTWFPGKKLFGNKNRKFVDDRQRELQQYMSHLLSIDPLCKAKPFNLFLKIPPEQSPLNQEHEVVGVQDNETVVQMLLGDAKRHFLDLAQQSDHYLEPVEQDIRSATYRAVLEATPCTSKVGPTGLTDSQHRLLHNLFVPRPNGLPLFESVKNPDTLLVPCTGILDEINAVREAAVMIGHAASPDRLIEGIGQLRVYFPSGEEEAPIAKAQGQPVVVD